MKNFLDILVKENPNFTYKQMLFVISFILLLCALSYLTRKGFFKRKLK